MPEPRPDIAEHTETLLNPGREHLADMRQLADRMVFMFGVPTDDSRTMVWEEDGRTYFLGRGGHWQDITGEPQDTRNWLYTLEDSEVGVQPAYRIAPDNDLLAGNEAARNLTANILRREMVRRLLSLAEQQFSPSGDQPGVGTLRHKDIDFHLHVFTHADQPFAFIDTYGTRFQLAPDVAVQPIDPNVYMRPDNPLAGSVEAQLITLCNVLVEGVPRLEQEHTYPAWNKKTPEYPIGEPENLTSRAREFAEEVMVQLQDWPFNSELPDTLYCSLEDADELVITTVLPRAESPELLDAVGMVIKGRTLTVETVSLNADEQFVLRVEIDLTANTARAEVTSGDETYEHLGDDAYFIAEDLMTAIELAAAGNFLQKCTSDMRRKFYTRALRPPTKTKSVE